LTSQRISTCTIECCSCARNNWKDTTMRCTVFEFKAYSKWGYNIGPRPLPRLLPFSLSSSVFMRHVMIGGFHVTRRVLRSARRTALKHIQLQKTPSSTILLIGITEQPDAVGDLQLRGSVPSFGGASAASKRPRRPPASGA
jgi:hypothetical protein